MTFEDWMLHRGLTLSSAKKYAGAIQGLLSEWAIENNLLAGPLITLTSLATFRQVDSKIRSLPAFVERNLRGHHMYSSALVKFSEYLAEGFGNDVEEDIDLILEDLDLSKTERSNLVKSRIGQGLFRQRLLTLWKQCAVTGFKDTSLLVASHIKPWRSSSNSERLDGFNGLLLTPNLDKAFDCGFVTFDSTGLICISPLLKDSEKLGITLDLKVDLSAKHKPFMNFHRENVYRAS